MKKLILQAICYPTSVAAILCAAYVGIVQLGEGGSWALYNIKPALLILVCTAPVALRTYVLLSRIELKEAEALRLAEEQKILAQREALDEQRRQNTIAQLQASMAS